MVKPLPKWEMVKYSILWKHFGKKEFTNEMALKVLKDKNRHILSVLFYDLKKAGWIQIERDEKDQRKKKYKLKEPNELIKEIS